MTAAERSKRYREKHPERVKASWSRYAKTIDNKGRVTAYYSSCRQEVLDHYGRSCVCCGETIEQFLTLDHINGNGAAHRREIGMRGGSQFYCWLRRNNYPEGFQILCMNCNHSKGHYGRCPHEAADA